MAMPRTSTRDPQSLLYAFGSWLRTETNAVRMPTVVSHGGPTGAGLSSDTLLLDVTIDTGSGPTTNSVVLRLPPPDDAFPVFESYDFALQVEAMRIVRLKCNAPVPKILWSDTSGSAIGVPFFVMERIDGIVPPDVPPYTWGSWVTELDDAQITTMTLDSIATLAAIHSVQPSPMLVDAERSDIPDSTSLERHIARLRRHFEWARNNRVYPSIERGFTILGSTVPLIDREDVLIWGDARIGNILWNDARAVAIIDWEMTTVGPRELDVAWLSYFATTFQRSAEGRNVRGVPTLLRRDEIVSGYERVSGVSLQSFDWFLALCGLHQSIIGIRTSDRSVAFGEWAQPKHPEAPIHSIPTLNALLDQLESD